MTNRLLVRRVLLGAAVALLCVGCWCLLWLFSSSSLAFTECVGKFELFSENTRCRQPSVAAISGAGSVVLAGIALYVARRLRS